MSRLKDMVEKKAPSPILYEAWGERADGRMTLVASGWGDEGGRVRQLAREAACDYRAVLVVRIEQLDIFQGVPPIVLGPVGK